MSPYEYFLRLINNIVLPTESLLSVPFDKKYTLHPHFIGYYYIINLEKGDNLVSVSDALVVSIRLQLISRILTITPHEFVERLSPTLDFFWCWSENKTKQLMNMKHSFRKNLLF